MTDNPSDVHLRRYGFQLEIIPGELRSVEDAAEDTITCMVSKPQFHLSGILAIDILINKLRRYDNSPPIAQGQYLNRINRIVSIKRSLPFARIVSIIISCGGNMGCSMALKMLLLYVFNDAIESIIL